MNAGHFYKIPTSAEMYEPKVERLPVVDQGIELARLLPDGSELRRELLMLTARVFMCSKGPVYIVRSDE